MQAITQQFEGVTPVQFDALRAAVKDKTGVDITGTSGTAQDAKKKWSVDFSFTPESGATSWVSPTEPGKLTITVTKAPWPDSMVPSAIATQIKDLVDGVLQG